MEVKQKGLLCFKFLLHLVFLSVKLPHDKIVKGSIGHKVLYLSFTLLIFVG